MFSSINCPAVFGRISKKMSKSLFIDQFKKIIIKKMDITWISCNSLHVLVVNPIMVYGYGFLFDCTTVGQATDSMAAMKEVFFLEMVLMGLTTRSIALIIFKS